MRRSLWFLCILVLTLGDLLAAQVPDGIDVIPVAEVGVGPGTVQVRTYRQPGSVALVRTVRVKGAPGAPASPVLRMAGDHLMVRFAHGFDHRAQAAAVAGRGMAVRRQLRRDLCTVSFPVTDAGSYDRARAGLLRTPGVIACEPDLVITIDGDPDDPRFGEQWALKNTGQEGGSAGADIRATGAWQTGTGSRSILVGIIDTGIDGDHPDLAPNMWRNPGETGVDGSGQDKRSNGIDDDGNGYVDDWRGWDFVGHDNDPHDLNGHGTHCAGVIGAVGDDGHGIAGVNWSVSLVGLRFLDSSGSGLLSDAIQAIDYARGIGCDITSNSWGAVGRSEALEAAVSDAGAAGQLFVCAAGNEAVDTAFADRIPANCTSPNVITVMATDRWDGRAYFSNVGSRTVHIAAPGMDILSTVPGEGYALMSGTSMAAPHVTGACALVKARYPGAAMDVIRARVLSGARPAGLPSTTGGILDCAAAVELIAGPAPVISELTVLRDGARITSAAPGDSLSVSARVVNIGTGIADVALYLDQIDAVPMAEIDDGVVAVGALASSASIETGPEMRFTVHSTTSPFDVRMRVLVVVDGEIVDSQVLTLPIRTMSSVSGRITSAIDGLPVRDQFVYSARQSGGGIRTTYTDADGRYSFQDLPDGSYEVGFPGFNGWRSEYEYVDLPPSKIVDVVLQPYAQFNFNWTNGIEVEQGRVAASVLSISNAGRAAGELDLSPEGIVCDMGGLWHMAEGVSHDEDGLSLTYGLVGTGTSATGAGNHGTLRFRSWAAADLTAFTFWERNDVPPGGGTCVCEVSIDGGVTWSTIWTSAPGDGSWHQVVATLPAPRSMALQIRWAATRSAATPGAIGVWSIDEPAIGNRFDAWLMTPWVHTVPEQVHLGVGESQDIELLLSGQGLSPGLWNCYPRFTDGQSSIFLGVSWHVLPAPVIVPCGISVAGQSILTGGGAEPLHVVLANQGASDADGLSVEVQAEGLEVGGGAFAVGTLASGDSVVASIGTLSVPEGYAGPEWVDVVVTARDADGRSWTESAQVQVITGPWLRGVVRDRATGAPIAGAQVTGGGQTVASRADGRFTIQGISEGDYAVAVTAAGFLAQEQTLSTGREPAIFELDSRRLAVTPARIDCELESGAAAIVWLKLEQSGSLPATIQACSWMPVDWLTLPEGMDGMGTHGLQISTIGLEPGTYTSWVTFASDATDAAVTSVPITLSVIGGGSTGDGGTAQSGGSGEPDASGGCGSGLAMLALLAWAGVLGLSRRQASSRFRDGTRARARRCS